MRKSSNFKENKMLITWIKSPLSIFLILGYSVTVIAMFWQGHIYKNSVNQFKEQLAEFEDYKTKNMEYKLKHCTSNMTEVEIFTIKHALNNLKQK